MRGERGQPAPLPTQGQALGAGGQPLRHTAALCPPSSEGPGSASDGGPGDAPSTGVPRVCVADLLLLVSPGHFICPSLWSFVIPALLHGVT